MKLRAILIVFLMPVSIVLTGQVMEEEKSMSKGVQTAVTAQFAGVDADFVENQWRDYIRDFGRRTKRDRRENEWFTDNAEIVSINPSTPVDVYAQFEERGEGAAGSIWFDLGTGFVNSTEYPNEFAAARRFMEDFQLFVQIAKIEENLDDQEKILKDLESDLNKLERDNENYHKEIEKAQEVIAENQSNIEQNVREQEQKNSDIANQMKLLEEIRYELDLLKKKQN